MWLIASLLVFASAACSGRMTLTEYAERLEEEVALMNARIDDVDVRLEEAESLDEVLDLWDERIAARERLLSAFDEVDPPDSAKEMHAAASDIIGRLTAAEAALGVRAAEFATLTDFDRVWETEEGLAARAADAEAIALCQAAQESFDETADREILADVSWMTSEMKEVVNVVFGCTPEQRQNAS
jgi:hypothetical protein